MIEILNGLEHSNLRFGYCLGFEICNLGFRRLLAHFKK